MAMFYAKKIHSLLGLVPEPPGSRLKDEEPKLELRLSQVILTLAIRPKSSYFNSYCPCT